MKTKSSSLVKLILITFFVVSVILPLLRMLSYVGKGDISRIIDSPQFLTAVRNSLVVTIVATVISVLIALSLAWSVTRTSIRYKGIISVILTLPMLIPSISHGMGLIILLGANGIITNFFSSNWNIYGFKGIVIGSVIYSFPVAFLMLTDIFRYEDSSPYEAANVLGIPKWNQFKVITLPYIRKPLISVVFAVFTMVITDYGVPLAIGGKYTTLPVMMYQEVVGLLDFRKGGVIGLVLLVPAIIAFILDLLNKDRGNLAFIIRPFEIKKNALRDLISYALCIVVILIVAIPIAAFVILSFTTQYPQDMSWTINNISKTFNMNGLQYLINSIIIAISVSIIGIFSAFVTAYFTARMPSKTSRLLHLISITSLAIPGIVLGLSYVLFFKGSIVYGTIAILILVNLIHFFASPYLMMYSSLGKINENLEAVGMTLGISRLRLIKDVFIPQTKSTILEMFSYFFVNSMMTISAVSFLATINNKTLSLMITQFEAQMMIESVAFVSLLILSVNMLVKGIIYYLKRRMEWKNIKDAY